jgi:hypothetical protein
MSPMTARASLGVSEAEHMRQRRWSTMPETVCTMVVKAATGKTYRAISMERFSAERSIFWMRFG